MIDVGNIRIGKRYKLIKNFPSYTFIGVAFMSSDGLCVGKRESHYVLDERVKIWDAIEEL